MVSENNTITISVLLPNTKIFGGVKRFLELGNFFVKNNCQYTIYTKEGVYPNWFNFTGNVKKIDCLENDNSDIIFFTELQFLPNVLKSNSKRKVFYAINPTVNYAKILKHKEIEVFSNSSSINELLKNKYKSDSYKAIGGINLKLFPYKPISNKQPDKQFVIMAYGRISKPKKGTAKVIKACEKLHKKGHNISLLLFDSPTDIKAEKAIKNFSSTVPYEFVLNHPVEKNVELFHKADLFISAETSGGWSNTSAEALASGTPVIATKVGTTDFIINQKTGILLKNNKTKNIIKAILLLKDNFELREKLSFNGRKKIEEFDWEKLAYKILENIKENLSTSIY